MEAKHLQADISLWWEASCAAGYAVPHLARTPAADNHMIAAQTITSAHLTRDTNYDKMCLCHYATSR
jgi:hypothetical protein